MSVVAQLVRDAVALRRTRRFDDAVRMFERALALAPEHPGALTSYAMLRLELGHFDAAIALARRAVAADPRRTSAKHVLGQSLCRTGALHEGIAALEDALALDPDAFDVHVHLGLACLEAGDLARAESLLVRAAALAPNSAAVQVNLGNVYRRARRFDDAARAYRDAIARDPALAQAHGNLGGLLSEAGDQAAAIAHLRQALALAPNPSIFSNLLLAAIRSDAFTPAAAAEEHRSFGRAMGERIEPFAPVRAARESGRIKVAYVSADFVGHAVALFAETLLRAHDRDRFEVYLLHAARIRDEVTARLEALAEHFWPVAALSDEALARRVRDAGIDIMVDLNGHTAGNRLPAFAFKPAPVQVTWLGYLATTGLATMDVRLTDDRADPAGTTEGLHTERLYRLPQSLWCYQPHAAAPAVGSLPADRRGHVTFASLNSPAKVSDTAIALWAELLRAVPDSRLLLIASPLHARRAALDAAFARSGIESNRVEHVPTAGVGIYLDRYNAVDVALDTWPCAGGTTTCDALWMGVPVVSLATLAPWSRGGASLLAAVGLPDLVSATPREYVATAATLAHDRPRLRALRTTLREQVRVSPLCDAPAFARAVENAFGELLRESARRSGANAPLV